MKSKYIFILFAIFFTYSTYSQAFLESSYFLKEGEFLNSSESASNTSMYKNQVDNQVFIAQVGVLNDAVLVTNSRRSDIRIQQSGDYNKLYFFDPSVDLTVTLMQDGNNHNLFYSNPFAVESQNLQVQQQGNNQSVELFGNNSISDKMIIKMQGENQNITIRNFN